MTPSAVLSPIENRLDQLRRRIWSWLLVDGLSRLSLCLAGLIAIDLLVDWSFQMDRAQRVVMLLLTLGTLAFVIYRRLWQPLAVRPTDDALCLQVEGQHPEFGESLISALQFSRLSGLPDGASAAMVQATVDRGSQVASEINFENVLHRRRFQWNVALLAFGLLFLGATAASVLATDTLSIWFNRNVLLGDREWPQDVHFEVAGAVEGLVAMPRGEDWPIEVLVTEDSRRLPQDVWLETRGTQRRQRLELLDGGRRFRTDFSGAVDGAEFRIVEARASSAWLGVRLIDRPAITELNLAVTPPTYTGLASEALPPGGGPYKVLPGSVLAIRGQTNKPVASGTLTIGSTRHALTVADGTRLSLDLSTAQVREGDYSIDLLDTDKVWRPSDSEPQPLTSREPTTFRLRIGADREPQVQAKLRGIGSLVTGRVLIPISCQITDDYAIADLRLQHRHRGEQDVSDSTGTQPLKSLAPLPSRAVRFEHVFDIEPLMLTAGVSLTFVVEADDNNNVSGPSTGRSTVFLVRVVTEEEFRAALLVREREQRIEFEKRVKLQDELKTECEALLAASRGRPDLSAEQRDQLARFEKRQKTVGDDVARIARKFEDVVLEVRQNRIEEERGPVQTRLSEQIIAPLWKTGNDGVDVVLKAIERTRLSAANIRERDQSLTQTVAAQQKLLEQMRAILSHMEQAEGFQEAVNLLLEVQKAQQDVQQRTEKEKQEAIRKLLDGAGKKP